ncbi:hypothetical protein [Dactylosporangium sp. NPDC051484]|uniref:hypothetical protein n=1 Tax=Dactylosporangium sp. NPDC051484 TaxID=3154942 RepID=UPI00344C650B
MRRSALGGACVLVVGLAALAAGLYYDQAHLTQWTHFAESSDLTRGPIEAETARIFTLLGAVTAAFAATIAGGSTVLAALTGRTGVWVLRLISVLLLVLMLLVTAALVVGSLTGDAPVAIIDTPWWLLATQWSALALAVAGAGTATTQLWRFVPDS